MTDSEKREGARRFYQKWVGRGEEDKDDRSYWLDILQRVLGAANATDRVDFQKSVVVNGNSKRIDGYIRETSVHSLHRRASESSECPPLSSEL